MLVFRVNETDALINSLIGSADPLSGADMRAYEHEAMSEIGNIIISSSVAVMADMLGGEIMLAVPEYAEIGVNELIGDADVADRPDDRKLIVMSASLNAAQRKVEGKLIILLDIRSLEELLDRIDEFLLGGSNHAMQ